MKIILQRLKYRILAHTMTWLIASQLQPEYWFAAVALQLCRFYSFRRLRRLCQLYRILFFSPIIDFFSFCKSFIVFFYRTYNVLLDFLFLPIYLCFSTLSSFPLNLNISISSPFFLFHSFPFFSYYIYVYMYIYRISLCSIRIVYRHSISHYFSFLCSY